MNCKTINDISKGRLHHKIFSPTSCNASGTLGVYGFLSGTKFVNKNKTRKKNLTQIVSDIAFGGMGRGWQTRYNEKVKVVGNG
jgi:hypothetical protein